MTICSSCTPASEQDLIFFYIGLLQNICTRGAGHIVKTCQKNSGWIQTWPTKRHEGKKKAFFSRTRKTNEKKDKAKQMTYLTNELFLSQSPTE